MASEGGLRVYSSIGVGAGAAPNLAFKIATGISADIFEGDLMKMVDATGSVLACTQASDSILCGVFAGCEFTNSDGQRVWSNKYTDTIARDDTVAYVNVNPFQLYKIRVGTTDVDGTITRAEVGGNFDLDYNAGNSVSGKSGMILDTGTTGVATIAQVRLVGVTNDDGTDDAVGAAAKTFTHGIVMIDPLASFWISAGIQA